VLGFGDADAFGASPTFSNPFPSYRRYRRKPASRCSATGDTHPWLSFSLFACKRSSASASERVKTETASSFFSVSSRNASRSTSASKHFRSQSRASFLTRSKRARSVFGGVTHAAVLRIADAFESESPRNERYSNEEEEEEEEERRAPREI
jgi:hypothetical protein